MIVDDSVVIRGAVSRILGHEEDMRVVGLARDGREALERLPLLAPDVLVLDIEMPEVDGLEVLRALRARESRVRVLVFSSYTRRGAQVTIEALSLWAHDYVLKPSTLGGQGVDDIGVDLVCKIRALVARGTRRVRAPTEPPERSSEGRWRDGVVDLRAPGDQRIDVVAIAASTGGPKALMAVLSSLPQSLPVPIAIVQHMPPRFTAQLAKSLDRRCALAVCEGRAGDLLAAGTVYLAPGGRHLGVGRRRDGRVELRIHDRPPEHGCRPAADVLFRDVAAVYGRRASAVVLTGMGSDGTAGCRAIVAAGGEAIVQDRATSVIWSMPGHVATSGLACAVLPLSAIAAHLVARTRRD